MTTYLVQVDAKMNRRIVALSIKKEMPKYELLPILLEEGLRYEDEREQAIKKS